MIGGGPAGLTAAFYASREGLSVLVLGTVALTKEGFLDAPDFHATMTGVFAAGDARAGSTKQVASAVGEGAAAALEVRHYLEEIGEARHVEVEMMPA